MGNRIASSNLASSAMIILGIETSCDETALSIIDIQESAGGEKKVKILANQVLSQIELHKQYGGVFPMMAKREHSRNIVPLLKIVLTEAGLLKTSEKQYPYKLEFVRVLLEREPEMLSKFLEFIPTIEKPSIDLIAVTAGPGLEPALWVGINFAKALSVAWDIPVVPTNHMEGHVLIALLQSDEENHKSQETITKQITNNKSRILNENPTHYTLYPIPFPALALLISGGHTELVLMKKESEYEVVGRTRDDAIGEAFDKVARILGLPYPGGPEISALAEIARMNTTKETDKHESIHVNPFSNPRTSVVLPRPMLHSDNLDFSFSGLKTAVLYLVKKLPTPLDEGTKMEIAREFEDAATEVVVEKVRKAVETYGVQTLILGGGVVANKNIRTAFETLSKELDITLKLPAINHATDNALMIALAGYLNKDKALTEITSLFEIKADGNLSLCRNN
ncbi:MAG: tRNA (adenosine(37)-N6)-threonylcarbamoyltransferase complex transferase subunit TsaD [bacterium]|nr:tRNA (adenosine(37)-N6)-threonylcarbamoyltransferase complex transferase subunit TsaD [bacterium]